MLSLICISSLILTILVLNIMVTHESGMDSMVALFTILFSIFAISVFIIIIMLFFYPYKVDAKIEMYNSENQEIETKVKNTVKSFMEYEEKIYSDILENADLMTMILKYPELNSNELVKMEIDMYKENSEKIKELKEEKIIKKTMAWWLYFGK